jgi:rhamnose transport system substrate-binding protein
MAKGIIVLAINSDMNPAGRQAAIVPAPWPSIGPSQIQLMSQLMGGHGQFAILSATTTAPDQNYWIQGMQATLKKPQYKGLDLVKIAYGNDDPATSTSQTEALLAAYPNLKGILSPTTVGVSAAAAVIQQRGLADKIAVTGLGDPNEMRAYVENGTVKAFQLWDASKEGVVATYLIHAMLSDHYKPAPGTSFMAGPEGKRTFDSKGETVGSPLMLFNKQNIAKYNF